MSASSKMPLSADDSSISSSSASSSRPAMTPRRSLAHAPRLLGLGEDGIMELRGLGISSSASERFPLSSSASSAKSMRIHLEELDLEGEEEQFKIEEEDESETLAGHGGDVEAQNYTLQEGNDLRRSGESHRKSASALAPIRVDSYKRLEGYQIEQVGEEESIMMESKYDKGQSGNDGEIDLEGNGSARYTPNNYTGVNNEEQDLNVDADEVVNTARLYFEPITRKEKIWMMTSVVVVVALTLVSISISVDWIDWPNDGIGKY